VDPERREKRLREGEEEEITLEEDWDFLEVMCDRKEQIEEEESPEI
jgi:hypothetical protein